MAIAVTRTDLGPAELRLAATRQMLWIAFWRSLEVI